MWLISIQVGWMSVKIQLWNKISMMNWNGIRSLAGVNCRGLNDQNTFALHSTWREWGRQERRSGDSLLTFTIKVFLLFPSRALSSTNPSSESPVIVSLSIVFIPGLFRLTLMRLELSQEPQHQHSLDYSCSRKGKAQPAVIHTNFLSSQ